ncbi:MULTISPECIES: hypothetical protein [unclassified Streptomyces]|uniref:hypothetical protein n=1 Tax=unclassified Streptomyces TaxID=2593676 RepID=UPI003823FFD9
MVKPTDRRSFTGSSTTQADPATLAVILHDAIARCRDEDVPRAVLEREQAERQLLLEQLGEDPT